MKSLIVQIVMENYLQRDVLLVLNQLLVKIFLNLFFKYLFKGIGGAKFISFEDRHWHNDCFVCFFFIKKNFLSLKISKKNFFISENFQKNFFSKIFQKNYFFKRCVINAVLVWLGKAL